MSQQTVAKFGPVVGRTLIVLVFMVAGLHKITDISGATGYIASKGLPMPQVLAWLTVAVEVGASFLIILGLRTRLAAAALLVFTALASLIFHQFWNNDAELINFLKNLAIIGGLLYVIAHGPGAYSMDKR